ncbi:TIGR02444 family protein [Rhizobium oryzicola]|uniref:TIGR02444 family protein n=1 Tax=Rhizobium oryzicola TaxID=1232668 RepID=A0ABT8SXA1_9HYPH|nr:TIGR02444 family protein [Rhizobium oryzicola]MDO1582503.1 TIGR02444 family protein [Rhizobium oryzicola]
MQDETFSEMLWPDMLRLYAMPDVAPLCLSLQDEADVDVPLLLFLVLADRHQLGCSAADLQTFLSAASQWRETVLRPLRDIRRAMKNAFDGEGETALRDEIKRLELQAEKQHVARLARNFTPSDGAVGLLARRYLTERAIPAHLLHAFKDVFPPAVAALGPMHSSDIISMTSARTIAP